MSYYLRYIAVALALAVIAGCSTMGGSQSTGAPEESDLAVRAAQVLQNQMNLPDQKRIPQDLVSSAKCIAVFPRVIQAGFIVGGRQGTGLVACRQGQSGWTQAAPAVYSLTGGSLGLLAGVEKSSVILLFATRDSMNSLLSSKLKLGSDIGVTAGPIGFNADIASAPAPVVSYVASKTGLFAGVSLNGTRLGYKQKANSRIYGQDVSSPRAILLQTNQIPTSLQPFAQTLQNYASSGS